MTTFYLIRHGQKEKLMGDPELSALGIEQAKRTGAYLRQFPIEHIAASPLKRTQQTAEIIAQELGLKPETAVNLRERVNWGDIPDQSFPEFVEMWDELSLHRDLVPAAGDSSRQAGERFKKVMTHFVNSPQSQVVLVTHGGIIADFLRNVFPGSLLNQMYDNFLRVLDLAVKECSITIVESDGQAFHLKQVASVEHLESTLASSQPSS